LTRNPRQPLTREVAMKVSKAANIWIDSPRVTGPAPNASAKGALRTSVGMMLKYGTRVYHLLAQDCRAVLIGHNKDYKKHA
jgi:hypothetical protein